MVAGMADGDREDLGRRALAAWFRTGETEPVTPEVAEHAGRRYVVLRDSRGAVAGVYRVRRHDGMLQRMRRPPAEIMAG